MNKYVVSAALILTAGTPAFAQEITFANVELGFGSLSEDDLDLTTTILDGEVEYTIGQFFFSASGEYNKTGSEFVEFDQSVLGIQAGYMPIDGVMVGAGFERSSINYEEQGFFEGEVTSTLTEIFGQFEGAQFDVALTYQESEIEDFSQPSFTELLGRASATSEIDLLARIQAEEDADDTDYDLGLRYEAGPIEAVARYGSSTEGELAVLSIDGAYDINDQLIVQAGYETVTGDDFDEGSVSLAGGYLVNSLFAVRARYAFRIGADASDVAFYEVGAEYGVADNTTLSIDYGEALNSSVDQSAIRLTLSYELGETARVDSQIEDDFELDDILDRFFSR